MLTAVISFIIHITGLTGLTNLKFTNQFKEKRKLSLGFAINEGGGGGGPGVLGPYSQNFYTLIIHFSITIEPKYVVTELRKINLKTYNDALKALFV